MQVEMVFQSTTIPTSYSSGKILKNFQGLGHIANPILLCACIGVILKKLSRVHIESTRPCMLGKLNIYTMPLFTWIHSSFKIRYFIY